MEPPVGSLWDADIDLPLAAAARLIEWRFPGLGPARLTLLGEGWDNVAYRVNDDWVFRFPRRRIAADLLAREARILPLLAPALPLRVTAPAFVGAPTPDYPYMFTGYAILPGRTACQYAWSTTARRALAPMLGHFLRHLHQIPIDEETRRWAPRDDIHRAVIPTRVATVAERLRANHAGLDEREVHALLDLVHEMADRFTPASRQCWVHGDFYARHLVLDNARRPVGVIDWGDAHLGDPALDLSIAFSFLPASARPAFFAEYGMIDEATTDRARFRAIHYGAMLAAYGADIADPTIATLGDDALRLAVTT
jgi:aminoglycoside phosphotransferase (APT) family kinase protein